MASVESNIDHVMADLDKLAAFGFTNEGGRAGKRLGDELFDLVAVGIRERTVDRQRNSFGERLAPNQGLYGLAKEEMGLPIGIGFGESDENPGGQMLSNLELTGERVINPNEAEMTYGKDGWAKRKAQWFTNGTVGSDGEKSGARPYQAARPFYALDAEIEATLDTTARERLDEHVKTNGGA